MAYYYNFKFWLATADQINDTLLKREVLKHIKPTQDKNVAHDFFSMIYARFVTLVNWLSYLFDITLQVQKRALIQRLLEAATNRLLEVRNELKQIELSEYIYLDDALIKQKISLDEIQLLRPFYFPMDRDPHIQNLVDNKIKRKMPDEDTKSISQLSVSAGGAKMGMKRKVSRLRIAGKATLLLEMAQTNPEQYNRIMAANLIKVHEKARKGRVFLTNIRYHPEKYRPQAPDIGKGFFYEYTHKPEQPMLILVKRTNYDSNYILERHISDKVDFYVRPMHRQLKLHDIKAKSAKGSDDGSLEDDFIQFEGQFEGQYDEHYEEGYNEARYEYGGSDATSKTSDKSLGKPSTISSRVGHSISVQEVKEKIKSLTSLGDLTKLAQTIQVIEEEAGHVGEAEFAERISQTINADPKFLETGDISRKGSKTLHPAIVEEQEMGTAVLKETSVIMEGGKKRQDYIPSEPKPKGRQSGVNIGKDRSKLSVAAIMAQKSLDFEKGEEMTLSFQTLLSQKINDSAASIIQAAWRRYLLKKRIEKRKMRKLILYGMVSEWRWDQRLNKDFDETRMKLRAKKALFDKQFIEAVENEKARILKVRGPWIMEDISDHIRAWFREFYDGVGEFDRYPEEFEGGTILVIRGETMTVDEFRIAKEEKKNKKKKTPEEKKRERELKKLEREKKKEQKKKEKALAKLQKQLEAKMGKTYDFAKESEYVGQMRETMEEYEKEWANIDEKNNVNEDPYMEWISLDKFCEAHQELRIIVDELMRVEFELLRKALAEDLKKKYKPQKKKKQKKKKGKGKRGKKQPKDITADRTTEDLYFELESYGVIRKFPPADLDDYIGEYNYSAYEKRLIYMMDPPPGQGEIKSVIREAILGMGPLNLPKAKSLCLAGPANSGKQFLVNAIIKETGAIVFDISPEKVVAFEDNMKYFIHLINKMARILQPTILFIDNCERIFWKKVPKEDADIKPRLLGKYIIKQIVKPIKKDEKVLLLGTSDEPFKGKLGKMKKCWEKVILVPPADYGTTFQLNRVLALRKYGVPREFDFSAVSMVSKSQPSSRVFDNINTTLGIERRMKLSRQPLKAQEIIEGFIKGDQPQFPITEDEFAKYTKFYTKVNKLAKQRDKFMKEQAKLKEKEKPKGKK